MIEIWCAKAWNSRLVVSRRKLAARMCKETFGFLKHLPSKRTGIALTISMPLLVVVWHLLVLAGRPSHLDEIVAELGSTITGLFYHDPMPDRTGKQLLFIESMETGYGVYLYHTGDGKRKLLYVDTYKNETQPFDELIGWSPDNKFLAYSRRTSRREIVICDGDSGDMLAIVPIKQPVISSAWLSPQTLVYADDQRVLHTVREAHGKWSQQLFSYFRNRSHKLPNQPIQNVTAFDTNSVVWQQGNTIWSCGENSTAPAKIWNSTTNTLLEFSYSQAANRFLLHCKDVKGQFFANFYPEQTDRPTVITRINLNEYRPTHLTLINDGKGYTFISHVNAAFSTMVVKPDDSHDPIPFQWPNRLRGFAADQHEVFVTSSLNNGPTGIWKYDLATGAAECVVPMVEAHCDYLTNCTIERNSITNASGEILTYYLYAPPQLDGKKKHPLILGILGAGPTGYDWISTHEAFANADAYFVYIERDKRDYSQWAEDVLTVYKNLAKWPDIDTNRVYLYGVSAGAPAVYNLLEGHPELWRDVILFSPAGLPDPSRIHGTRIFLDCGGSDPGFGKSGQRAIQFQDEAANDGIPVTLLIHPGMGHVSKVPPAERDRTREALIFLNER